MRILDHIVLFIAIAALAISIGVIVKVDRLAERLEAANANVCINSDEAMESIKNSFEMNRLDFDLHWTTPEGEIWEIGVFR